MENFKIEISSVFDRENLVAEIWDDDKLICELNTENNSLEIIFYINKKQSYDYHDLINAINEAKIKLVGNDTE